MSNKNPDRFDGVLLGKSIIEDQINSTLKHRYKIIPQIIKLCNREPETIYLILGVAQDCEGGVQEMLDVIFGFLARKTDFYASGLEDGKAKDLIDAAFKKHSASAEEEAAKKKVSLM